MPHGVLHTREVRLLFPGINSFSSSRLRDIYCLCKRNRIVFMLLLLPLCVARMKDNVEKRGKERFRFEVEKEGRQEDTTLLSFYHQG